MEKLYKVSLYDHNDGGYLLDESIYKDPLEARKEFKRVKKWLMENDMYYGEGEDDIAAFTNFNSTHCHLKFEVVKANERMTFTEQEKCKLPVYDKYASSVELFTKGINKNINESAKSFKDIYLEAKRFLYGSFVAGRMIDGKMYITLDPEDRDKYGYVNIIVSKDGNKFKAELETHVNWN